MGATAFCVDQAGMSGEAGQTKKEEHVLPGPNPSKLIFFTLLVYLTAVIVLVSSGSVGIIDDVGFVLFSVIYVYFISNVSFSPMPQPHDLHVIQKTKTFQCYILTGALVGIILPVLYILECVLAGDNGGIKAAAPHLFLLASQVVMERISFYSRFSIPVIVFVPVFYNSRRISTLVQWLRTEMLRTPGSPVRVFMGRALATVNMGFWFYNLFCFLIPVYIPRAMKKYYSITSA